LTPIVPDKEERRDSIVRDNRQIKMADNTATSSTAALPAASSATNSVSSSNSEYKTGNGTANLSPASTTNHTTKSTSPVPLNFEEYGLSIGSVVALETFWDKKYEGEVMSFDYGNKLLLLKCAASTGTTTRHDVHMINLNFVRNLEKKQNGRKDGAAHFDLPDLKIKKVRTFSN
jgi:hypothetical protein